MSATAGLRSRRKVMDWDLVFRFFIAFILGLTSIIFSVFFIVDFFSGNITQAAILGLCAIGMFIMAYLVGKG
jgi:hypothetical protein